MNEDNASDLMSSADLYPVLKEWSENKTLRMESTEQNNFEYAFNKRRILTIQVGC